MFAENKFSLLTTNFWFKVVYFYEPYCISSSYLLWVCCSYSKIIPKSLKMRFYWFKGPHFWLTDLNICKLRVKLPTKRRSLPDIIRSNRGGGCSVGGINKQLSIHVGEVAEHRQAWLSRKYNYMTTSNKSERNIEQNGWCFCRWWWFIQSPKYVCVWMQQRRLKLKHLMECNKGRKRSHDSMKRWMVFAWMCLSSDDSVCSFASSKAKWMKLKF